MKYRNTLFFWCLSLLFLSYIHAGNRQILFFVDWHNETVKRDLSKSLEYGAVGFGPITIGMLANLWQKAAPMIVSSATWKNFLERKQIFLDFINMSQQELVTKYQGKSTRFGTLADIQRFEKICKILVGLSPEHDLLLGKYSGFYICHLVEFNEHEWVVSKISEHVYLFIPKAYQTEINKKILVRNATVAPGVTDDDLHMGLKYSNKPLANVTQINTHNTDHSVNFSQEFVQSLSNLFVTQQDITNPSVDKKTNNNNKSKYMHTFDAYGTGHGGHGGIIMALPTHQFGAFLQFFNDSIRTRFVFYDTCYAGGAHLQEP